MRLSHRELKRMIIEEMQSFKAEQRLQEGTSERPIKLTAVRLNKIIQEEYARHKRQQLAESRRRR
jgi:hypothetical protein